MPAHVIKAPNPYHKERLTVFFAGSIDQGKAKNWQKDFATVLAPYDITILDPRRDDWDDSWKQEANDPQFRQQVLWELKAQEDADLNLFMFTKESEAPITFLELGTFGRSKDAMVCVEEGFYRQGNVDIWCERYNIPVYHNQEEFLQDVKKLLDEHFTKE